MAAFKDITYDAGCTAIILLHSNQDVNVAYYFRSENQTEPPSLADRRSL